MLTKNEFYKKLKEARACQLLIERRLSEIFGFGNNFEDIPFQGDNSDNLDEAIQCYIHYGEMPMSGDLDDFWNSYKNHFKKEEKQNEQKP